MAKPKRARETLFLKGGTHEEQEVQVYITDFQGALKVIAQNMPVLARLLETGMKKDAKKDPE
jgi:hypothetical protein